ncbi:MAG TPA: hypothetical protein VGB52_14070 [Actinomycetota bacterium]
MCYNCGCGLPDEDHGNADNVTNETFEKAGSATGQDAEAARANTLSLLQKVDIASGQTS